MAILSHDLKITSRYCFSNNESQTTILIIGEIKISHGYRIFKRLGGVKAEVQHLRGYFIPEFFRSIRCRPREVFESRGLCEDGR